MATLDTTALSESVSSAQLTLASDEAKLAQDETQPGIAYVAIGRRSRQRPPRRRRPTGGTGGSQSTITQDENAVTQDEAKTAADQQQEAADQAQAQKECGTGTTTSTSSTTTTTTTTTNPANCEAAIAKVSKDQQQVSADEAAVAKAEAALGTGAGRVVVLWVGHTGAGTARAPSPRHRAGSGSTPGGPNVRTTTSEHRQRDGHRQRVGGAGGGTDGTSADTPQQIAADQAAIDSAQADLTDVEQSLAEANLTSPINGTVVSVGISPGDTVSADSSTEVIEIIGTQSFEVVGTLSSTQVPSVKVGDRAGVQVDGVDGTIDGTVSQVGPVQSATRVTHTRSWSRCPLRSRGCSPARLRHS